jgi:Uma2 family endonuclease
MGAALARVGAGPEIASAAGTSRSEGFRSLSLPQSRVFYSADEYLALEREAVERHEYLDGEIYEMAGESPEHGTICTNIGGQLYNQLRGKDCRVFSKDMKVRSGPTLRRGAFKGLFSYPDLVVVCGELKFLDDRRDVLLNPTVIIEVLSPSTEAFDRGEKWARYQTWLPELSDYVLVSQSAPRIDHYRRARGEWIYTLADGLEGRLRLDSIDCELLLADVYDRIVFPAEPEDEE